MATIAKAIVRTVSLHRNFADRCARHRQHDASPDAPLCSSGVIAEEIDQEDGTAIFGCTGTSKTNTRDNVSLNRSVASADLAGQISRGVVKKCGSATSSVRDERDGTVSI